MPPSSNRLDALSLGGQGLVDGDVAASFRRRPEGGFLSRTDGRPTSCPPFTIADVVIENRVKPDALTLPAGYDLEILGRIRSMTGFPGEDVFIEESKAAELADLAAQILVLDDRGEVTPPLAPYERDSISHLVTMVRDESYRHVADSDGLTGLPPALVPPGPATARTTPRRPSETRGRGPRLRGTSPGQPGWDVRGPDSWLVELRDTPVNVPTVITASR